MQGWVETTDVLLFWVLEEVSSLLKRQRAGGSGRRIGTAHCLPPWRLETRASQCAQEACGAPAHILILPPCEPLSGCSGLWGATTKQARTATRLCSQSAKGALYALTSSSQRQNLLWDHEEEGCIYCGKAVSRSCHGAWVSTKAHPQVGAEGRRDTLRGEAWQKAGSLKGMPFKERMGF